jgi:endonuclease YncB( thermonuclease family)
VAAALAAGPRLHDPWQAKGTVARVYDGDTFDPRTEDRSVVLVRFSGTDAPERGQAYSRKSTEYLQSLLQGKPVRVRCYKDDGNGREVCDVDVGGQDIGLAMIEAGLAWHFKRFEQEEGARRAYAAAEERARTARLGLWAFSAPPMRRGSVASTSARVSSAAERDARRIMSSVRLDQQSALLRVSLREPAPSWRPAADLEAELSG